MKITMIGCGYVGLVSAVCFSEMGNDVWCVDVDETKIDNLKKGIMPIYEPGLDEMLKRNLSEGRLLFTTNMAEAVKSSLFVFIAVGTPPMEDGSADLIHVSKVAESIGASIDKYTIVITKSTVPVGTAEMIRSIIRKQLEKRGKSNVEFDVASNPEFLKEGDAVNDFMRPDRIIIGCDNPRTSELLRHLYEPYLKNNHPLITMNIQSAELAKYAANAMLATRISFINEISELCEATGADVESIRLGIGSDSRIGMSFLYPGLGYGGSCFPKDVKALIKTFKNYNIHGTILDSVDERNKNQRKNFINRIFKVYSNNVKGKTFAIWGLAFKPQTDDMREAPSIDIINALRDGGANINAHDPIAYDTARSILGEKNINYYKEAYAALEGADAVILVTEWRHFRNPDFTKIKNLLKTPVIFDGRNQYDPFEMKSLGFEYFSIGR